MAAYDQKENMKKVVSYDKENDILSIHKGFSEDEQFKGNLDLGDIILDVSTKQRIRGIELFNASAILKEFDINEHLLARIIDTDFTAIIKPQSIILGMTFKTNNAVTIPAKIAVPLLEN